MGWEANTEKEMHDFRECQDPISWPKAKITYNYDNKLKQWFSQICSVLEFTADAA